MILAYDAFRRQNVGGLGVAWTPQAGSPTSFDIFNNTAIPNNLSGNATNVFSQFTWPDNHYSKGTIVTIAGAGGADSGGGVGVRLDTATETGYFIYANTRSSGNDTTILKIVTGAATTLYSGRNNWVPGDEIYLQAIGTNLIAKRNGVQITTVSDGAIATGSTGLSYSSAIDAFSITNWEGGDFNSEPTHSLLILVSDNLNRPNSTGLGSSWSSVTGIPLPNIVNQIGWSDQDPYAARYSAIQWPRNQFSQCRILDLPQELGAVDGVGVSIRMNSSGSDNFYYFIMGGQDGRLRKRVAGFETDLSLFSSGTYGDLVYLSGVGSTLTVKLNNEVLFITQDTTFTSGQSGVFGSGVPDIVTFNDWVGGGESIFPFPQSVNIFKRNRVIVY